MFVLSSFILFAQNNSILLNKFALAESYENYFAKNQRFRIQNMSKANAILTGTKIGYRKIIHDDRVLERVARKMRVESILRTKIYKEGPKYRFVIDWLHSPKMYPRGLLYLWRLLRSCNALCL